MPVTTDTARLALDTILQKPVKGIPSWMLHIMEHSVIERIAGAAPGSYKREPETTYLAMQRAIGTCLLDQYIPENPLTMEDFGYEGREKKAHGGCRPDQRGRHVDRFSRSRGRTLGARRLPAHPQGDRSVRRRRAGCGGHRRRAARLSNGSARRILKSGYAFVKFPHFAYSAYGYANYFSAYAIYPDVLGRHFSLQGDLALLHNRAATRAFSEGALPPLIRLDHDIADSCGTLVNPRSLDRIWLPHFARCLKPLLRTDVRMIWHCDGNLMQMVPRLLDVGIRGFQGFQYEDGMDYKRICAMKTRDGDDLLIIGGASVTRTLPFGKPDDVKRELSWLVEHGPRTGLFLGGSSSIASGTPWENIRTLIEGLRYYREHGRS